MKPTLRELRHSPLMVAWIRTDSDGTKWYELNGTHHGHTFDTFVIGRTKQSELITDCHQVMNVPIGVMQIVEAFLTVNDMLML